MAPNTASSRTGAVSDGQLIAMVREGDLKAYDGLYARHASIASTVARKNLDNLSDADDVVAEAFASVLQSLAAGKGPEQFFRAYLLSTVTRLAHHRNRKSGRTLPTSEETILDHKMTPDDPAIQAFESQTIARAFRSLPERWQSALWYLDVERMKPAEVAPILGLKPNAVSGLGMRAREGLRRQYLQMHVKETPEDDCTEFVSQLGSYVRGGLSKTAEAKVRDHLDSCAKCTAILLELNDVQGAMRAVLLPLITGVPLAAWAGRASGLGVVGRIPGTSTSSGFAGISPAVLMPLTVAIGLGLVAGTIGLAVVLSGAPEPGAYHEIVAQSTQPALPSPIPATHAPPAPTATTPAPLPIPAAPTAHATPATQEPPVEAQALTPQPVPSPVPHTPAAPLPSPTPTPTPAPTLAQVSGTASRTDSGADPTTATVEVIFTLSRTDGPGTTTADFSIDNNAWIDSTSVSAPAGWNCTAKPADPANLSCITNSAQAGDLKFSLKLNTSHTWEETTFTYALSGPRIAANSFHLRL